MVYVCIIGSENTKKYEIANMLSRIGFQKNIPYSTSDNINGRVRYLRVVNREQIKSMQDCNMILKTETVGGELYCTLEPFGKQRYVGVDSLKGCKALKRRFKKQVITVYIKDTTYENGAEAECLADITVDNSNESNSIILNILSAIKLEKEKS